MVDFNSLNDQQKQAAQALLGRIKVVAGAGSGKTRVLATRYAYLADTIGIDTGNILCLTFTNKAAQEMKRRISSMIANKGAVNDFVCTIHGFCVKFLREEIFRLGYPKTFGIIDEEDRKAYAKKVMEALGQDRSVSTVKQFLANIDMLKRKMREGYVTRMLPGASLDTSDAFECFINEQLKTFALDFGDLIYFTIYILNNYNEVREKWQDRMNFIMVDEVQDCNNNDWEIISTLAARHGNLFMVGDPDQAIYEWRGARPDAFVDYPVDQQIILDENYRSTQNILDVANSVISNNRNRIKKDLFTTKPTSRPAIYFHGRNEDEEAAWVVDQIKKNIEAGNQPHDMAILYRAAHSSRIFEQALIQEGVPYTIWGGIRFFERKEIKDVIAYLKLIANPNDDMALVRIINMPSRKFGPKRLEALTTLAASEGTSLFTTLQAHIGEKPFDSAALRQFVDLITECQRTHMEMALTDLVNDVLRRSGLKDELRNDEDEDRLENVNELSSSIRLYENEHRHDEDFSLINYLQDIALYTNADYREDSSTVKLMTIHQAKGLEFPYVFVVSLTEGIFPSHRSIRERKNAALEEERRLMYVAVTRAEKLLFLTESEGYSYATGGKYPSRFITEIQDNLLEVQGHVAPDLFVQTRSIVRDLDDELYGMEKAEEYAPGTLVTHAAFGDGVVLENYSDRQSCKVQFATISLTLNYTKLEIKG